MAFPARFSKTRKAALAAGYRSGLEDRIAKELAALGVPFGYETKTSVIRYVHPEKPARYTPDFTLPNGIIVETKGRFMVADRQKHLLIQAQRPELDIRFVFQRSAATISKASTTTYADWCRKHGFAFADKSIPAPWLSEPPRT